MKMVFGKPTGYSLSVSITVRKNNQNIPNSQELRSFSLIGYSFWPRLCLGQRKVAFDDSFGYILSIWM